MNEEESETQAQELARERGWAESPADDIDPGRIDDVRDAASKRGHQLMRELPIRSMEGLTFDRATVDPRVSESWDRWVEESRALTRRTREIRRNLTSEAEAWVEFVRRRKGTEGSV